MKAASAQAPQKPLWTKAELQTAIETLSDREVLRLQKYARRLAAYSRLRSDYEDIIQDAYLQALDGQREFPRDVPIVTGLINAMRSNVSNELTSSYCKLVGVNSPRICLQSELMLGLVSPRRASTK